jgi:zinc transport system substrate-binding protein
MRKLLSLLLPLALLLSGCAPVQEAPQGQILACTTYPVYLLSQSVTEGTDTFSPVLVVDQPLSCLHNYTLTMSDRKAIDSAALLALNGAGMEEFLEDALEDRPCVDCSEGLELLWNEEEGEPDSHIWLDPDNAAQMAENLAAGLSEYDLDHAQQYQANAESAAQRLHALREELRESLAPLPCRDLIPFHDGFSYFAAAVGMNIAASVEEEEGSEASARRIRELVELIDEKHIPAVFTETNGPDATAKALAMERPIRVCQLNMLMSSSGVPEGLTGLDVYEWGLRANAESIREAYS